jgi:hypothetical protein
MTRTRTVTIDGIDFTVEYGTSGVRIIDPGKFTGEATHTVRDYNRSLDGWSDGEFGDVSTWGSLCWRIGHRFYTTTDQGFVVEIDEEDFRAAALEYERFLDEDRACEEALL